MSYSRLCYHNNNRRISKDAHALFGASKYSWLNYSDEKMIETYNEKSATELGTELHEIACRLIKNKITLPPTEETLNQYVNDAILFNLYPEEILYYSDIFFGTADAIGIANNILHIHDLKTGKTKASMHQLEIYAAFFFLEYQEDYRLGDFDHVELRIYQNNEVRIQYAEPNDILPIMDKIVRINNIISKMEESR